MRGHQKSSGGKKMLENQTNKKKKKNFDSNNDDTTRLLTSVYRLHWLKCRASTHSQRELNPIQDPSMGQRDLTSLWWAWEVESQTTCSPVLGLMNVVC